VLQLVVLPLAEPRHFPRFLQGVWDHHWVGTQMKIVLNGSHITAMKRQAGRRPGDNVARLILDCSGRLADGAERMLAAFLDESDVHYSIIQAIATGAHTWKDITQRVGKPGGSLSRPMKGLEEMQFAGSAAPVGSPFVQAASAPGGIVHRKTR